MDILVRSYTDDGYQSYPSIRLSDEEYAKSLQCFVIACADILPINLEKKTIYLASRNIKPKKGWWWIGGRMMPHDLPKDAAARNLKRETNLEIPQNRFKLVAVLDHRCKDREQQPQDIGYHAMAYTFTVELTDAETASASENLDKDEYKQRKGLSVFNRERLVNEKVDPAILDLYDHIFPG